MNWSEDKMRFLFFLLGFLTSALIFICSEINSEWTELRRDVKNIEICREQ